MQHIPVLLNEVLKSFAGINKNKWIVDLTLGRGGHFFEILKEKDLVLGLDADKDSIKFVEKKLLSSGFTKKDGLYIKNKKKVILVRGNFSKFSLYLKDFAILPYQVGGILVDLGISMFHIKKSGRGFSFYKPTEILDMRINTNKGYKAYELLSFLNVKELESLLRNLGDVKNAKRLAKNIVNYRKRNRIKFVRDLLLALNMPLEKPTKLRVHPATKVFMALRIAVNQEHLNLKELLNQMSLYLKQGVIFDVITFHSLEEKVITDFININKYKFDLYTPTLREILNNKSARSAKLFVIKK